VISVGFDTSGLDAGFKSHAHRGIGRYVRELNSFFRGHAFDGKSGVDVGYFNHTSFMTGRLVKPLLSVLPAGVNTVRQQILFPLQLSTVPTATFDFVHFPAHMDAPSWSLKRCIITVLDLIPLILKDLYLPEKGNFRFHFARWLEINAIKNAALILAISENTKKDLHRLLSIPEERIMVTPLGVDPRFHSAALIHPEAVLRERYKIPLDRPIILYVGGIDQRKNYRSLIITLRNLLANWSSSSLPPPLLVMAGNISGDQQFPKLERLIRESQLEDSVVLTGFVPDQDLLQLYSISSVFFFPSLYEGFGLPPLEAMAAGLPVVSSNTSCMPEILGEAAVQIDPLDHGCASKEIFELLNDPQKSALYRQRGKKRAEAYTWERTGQLTLQAYQQAAINAGLDKSHRIRSAG
jgi:glycosyltransferase involved in cell wall biosynthesis